MLGPHAIPQYQLQSGLFGPSWRSYAQSIVVEAPMIDNDGGVSNRTVEPKRRAAYEHDTHLAYRSGVEYTRVSKRMRFTMREGSVMSWKPRKCVIALLTLATLTCFAALIAVNIKPQHDAYPSSLSIKMGQNFSLGRNVNYFNKLKPNEENILMFWASWCQHCESLIEEMQQLDIFAALRKNLFTVSEDSTIEEASVHEGDFPIYID